MTITPMTNSSRAARSTMAASRTAVLALSLMLLGAGPGTAQGPTQGPAQDAPDLRALARALAADPELGAPVQPAPNGGPVVAVTPFPRPPMPDAQIPAPPVAATDAVPSVLDEGAPASGWPSSAADLERMARDAQTASAGDSTDPVAAAICAFLERHADGARADAGARAASPCALGKE